MNFWCEVSKNKLIQNVTKIKKLTNKKIVGVIKGNAYGLGIQEIASILSDNVDMFGVSSLTEANQLDTNKDILIMSPLSSVADTYKKNFIYTIDSESDLNLFDYKHKYRIHIYIDTGMNRLGINPDNVDHIINKISSEYPNIIIDGLYTHLHNASNIKTSKKQINILKDISQRYPKIQHIHCLNSKGIITDELREYADFTTIVRAGNILYGYEGLSKDFEKVFQIKAKVVKQYIINKDGFIGYNSKHKVSKDTKVGVLSCGTIDKIGYTKTIKTNILKDCLKIIKNHFIKPCLGYYNTMPIYTLCTPNMNCTLVDISNITTKDDIIINLNISSILVDSNIPKKYI